MSDAYWPADDIELLRRSESGKVRPGCGPFPQPPPLTEGQAHAYRTACEGIRFTETDGTPAEDARVRARHCEQARAGYFYCSSTRNDPCGPGRRPHADCTAGECKAPGRSAQAPA